MTKEERKIIEEKFDNGDLMLTGGDQVEYEIWLDEETGKEYNIPIEIKRYFDDMEEEENE
jgi:hypothetical protein